MKIVIFGATGFVGQQLVPILNDKGHELLVVGRSKTTLETCFPELDTVEYAEFDKRATGFDLAINLATTNTNSTADLSQFLSVNRDLLLSLAKSCQNIGVKRFVNFSSVHALDESNNSRYAKSKREGAAALDALAIDNYTNFYAPSVHGAKWSGQLAVLNGLPKAVAQFLFLPLAAMKPTVSIKTISDAIVDNADHVQTPLIISDKQQTNTFYHFTRRTIDICFVFLMLVLFWWLLLALWLMIKLDSKGPGVFAQERIGKNGNEFTCYKFRTMHVGTEQRGTHEVSSSSITKIGHFLRKYKLDELPQIMNLMKNEMSLIGPRPCLPNQVELIHERGERGVLNVKPGISGYAQVRNIDMSDPVLLANTDAKYVSLRGLMLDMKIAIQTAFGSGSGDRTRH